MMKKMTALFVLLLPISLFADEIAVTVYNSNLGVVSETRTLQFDEGTGQLAFRDVPTGIDAASVRLDVTGNRDVVILEQNYAYDLVSPEQIYTRYIDKNIDLIDKDGKLLTGMLLAARGGSVTLQDKSGGIRIVLLDHITEVDFPSLPNGLITKPTLFWKYRSDFDGDQKCKVAYQTSGLNWNAEYVGVLSGDEQRLDLSGWASINNTSGKTYDDATLKLIAGDINRAQSPVPRGMAKGMLAMDVESGTGFEEKAFFEYHMYTLPRKATLANKEIKQISLFEPASTTVEKKFVYRPDRNAKQVEVAIEFINSATTGLGMPLPSGRVRLFKSDDDGSLILLGEDRILHTPRDEEVKLKVGYAFDIAAKERLMTRDVISKRVEELQYEVEIRNHKKVPVTVLVEKRLWGSWEIVESSFEPVIKDAQTLTFELPVGADETVTATYRVRFSRQ